MAKQSDIFYLKEAIKVAQKAKDRGNHPFGAVLVSGDGKILAEGENTFQVDGGPGHAETNLARQAAREFDPAFLRQCTLYTSVEPCCMCSGNIYWANIGAVVFGVTEQRLGEMTTDHPENLTQDLPCRVVFGSGRQVVEVRGPFPEIEEEVIAAHVGFWDH